MDVAQVSCPRCGDDWMLPEPGRVREECRECGRGLEVERIEVTP